MFPIFVEYCSAAGYFSIIYKWRGTFRTERTTNSSSTETMESTGIAKTARLATRFQISFAFDLHIIEEK